MRFHSAVVLLLVALGVAVAVPRPLALPRYSEWSAPVNLGSPINSPFTDTGVTLSKHGLTLYFSSNRPCDQGDAVADFNLWVVHRSGPDAPWGAPECLLINADARIRGDAPYQDREPELSRDQHWLFFASDRPGSIGPPVPAGGDMWVSWRPNIFDDQGWTPPVPATELNTVSREGGPGYFENDDGGVPQLFFPTTRSGQSDIWVTDVVNGVVSGAARRVDEINTVEFVEAGSSIAHDGLEMFFLRGRAAAGISFDIYSTTRDDLDAAWSAPVNLGPVVNHATANEQEPKISPDRRTLFFASNRPGSVPGPTGAPSIDIWVTARTWGGGNR
jgi:hypothetical protein